MKLCLLLVLAGVQCAGAWTTTLTWPASPDPLTNYPSGYKSDSTASTFSGPGTVAFDWRVTQSPAPAISMNRCTLEALVDGAVVLSLAPNQGMIDLTIHSGSVTLPEGEHTVAWRVSGDPMGGFPSFSVTADATNIRLVNPASDIAAGLDTALTISNPSGWSKNDATQWRGNNRISLGDTTGGFSAEVTGPAVIAFRATQDGWNDIGSGPRGFLKIAAPEAASHDLAASAGSDISPDLHTRSFVIPEGTHTLTWSGQGAPAAQLYPGLTWHMDALEVFTPADFASALNNTLAWTAAGSPGHAPRPDATTSLDSMSVRFPGKAGQSDKVAAASSLTAVITGPAVAMWRHKARWEGEWLQVRLLGSPAAGLPLSTTEWKREILRIPPGLQTVSIFRDPLKASFEGEAWVDQFEILPPFESWLAGFLTGAELENPGAFSRTADIDGDGRNAFLEYALQTSPVAASQDREPALTRDPGNPAVLHFTWRQSSAAAGVTFTAQVSADLTQWSALAAVETGTDGSDKLMRAVLPVTAQPQWVRLQVQ